MQDTWTIHWLTASGDIESCRGITESEAAKAFAAASRVVEPSQTDIIVRISPFVIPELGVVGMCSSDTSMTISLNPENPNFSERAAPAISRTILHELHHCMRMKALGPQTWTLGRSIVLEGLADRFVEETVGGPADPWSISVAEEELNALAARARPLLEDSGYDHRAWFFGNKDMPAPLPRWGGYSLGWTLIDAYMRMNPGIEPSHLIATSAEDIIEQAWESAFGEA